MTDEATPHTWPHPEDEPVRRRSKRWYVLGALGLLVALYLTFFVVIGSTYSIPSESMAPAYPAGSRVWATRFGSVERGSVVIVDDPFAQAGDPPRGIRRVIAVGGDDVTAIDGKLVVNGEPVDEPYLAAGTQTIMTDTVTVPDGEIFLLGDARERSFDSRATGPQPESTIVGYVRFSI